MIYLSEDGNWGDATYLVVFDPDDLPQELYDAMVEDPEGSYEAVVDYLRDNGKEMR